MDALLFSYCLSLAIRRHLKGDELEGKRKGGLGFISCWPRFDSGCFSLLRAQFLLGQLSQKALNVLL